LPFEADLRQRLVNADLVGSRVYWERRPQGRASPAIVLQVVFSSRDHHVGGAMDTQRTRVQFSCQANAKFEAVTLRKAVAALIEQPADEGETQFQGGFVNFTCSDADDGVKVEQLDATVRWSPVA
jgi:hypothetical protein